MHERGNGRRDTASGGRTSTLALVAALGLTALFATGRSADDAARPAGVGGPNLARNDGDPIAAGIARWSRYLATHPAPASDETWAQITAAATPVVTAAEKALADGRRLLALQRLVRLRLSHRRAIRRYVESGVPRVERLDLVPP